jgi:hypothetical protein
MKQPGLTSGGKDLSVINTDFFIIKCSPSAKVVISFSPGSLTSDNGSAFSYYD